MDKRLGSQSDYARHRGCTQQNVSFAVKRGRITLEPDGKIDFDRADRDWPANTHPLRGGTRPGAGSPRRRRNAASPVQDGAKVVEKPQKPSSPAHLSQLTLARTRREEVAADAAQLDLRRRQGDLIDLATVKRTAYEIAHAVRDRLLVIPMRVRADLAASTEPSECEEIVRRELDSALEDLQRLGDIGQQTVQ
jgi:phage terminase Nu1 subunit (DNA packaging protein)